LIETDDLLERWNDAASEVAPLSYDWEKELREHWRDGRMDAVVGMITYIFEGVLEWLDR